MAVPIDLTFRMLRNGQVLEGADNADSGDPFQSTVLPTVPIGSGASWEVSKGMAFGPNKVEARATYTALSVNAQSARLHVTTHVGVTLTDKEGAVLLEGGGEGTSIWRADRFMPPGASGAFSLRMTQMKGSHHDKRGDAVCMQMTMGTS